MATRSLELSSARPSYFNTDVHTRARKAKTNNVQEAVQYRQLISRAVTQRLHSPSLEDLTKTAAGNIIAHTLEEWEIQERCIARIKARNEAEEFGIPWSKTALLARTGPHQIDCHMHKQDLTANSTIHPRCRKRHSASPHPHPNSVRSTAEKHKPEPRGD